MKKYPALTVLVLFIACGAPRIDTSSDKRMGASIARVRNSLPEAKRKQFDEAMVTLSVRNMYQRRTAGTTTRDAMAEMKVQLAGKTGEEVIVDAAKARSEAEARLRGEANAEIEKLEKARAAVDAAKGDLAKFAVLDAKFQPASPGAEAVIVLTVRNNTMHAVKRAYFVGTLVSPGRSAPWLRKDFGYETPGGIEPGKQATWRLHPDEFSDWRTIKPDKDAALEVEVTGLVGADGKRLFTDAEFTDQDAARLAALRKQHGL